MTSPASEALPDLQALAPEPAQPSRRFNPKTVSWWHEALADWMLQNPDLTIKDAAAVFGVTPTYLYMLKNSDTFKTYWTRRRTAVSEGVQDSSAGMFGALHEKLAALAEVSLDALNAKMAQVVAVGGSAQIPVNDLLQTADMALKKLGYGSPGPGDGTKTTVHVTVTSDLLAQAREKMAALHRVPTVNAGSVIDVTPIEEVKK